MNLKETIKRVLFWRYIRKRIIIRKHKNVAVFCRKLIDDYNKEAKDVSLLPAKKNLQGKRIIWQYWGQGYSNPDMPELVRICLDSVEKYCEGGEFLLIRLTDENISEYIDLPEYVESKRKSFPVAVFSDLLRTCLLTCYGGCWLDATVLLTGRIPEKYWNYDFFMYRRDEKEKTRNIGKTHLPIITDGIQVIKSEF
ncbi:MAG: capsular polysaccharide synthesis protein [Prevotellaceae bacterium]|nr:capsular polysaccharide synthesis protein [Prevotellaceae bacterium]